jgi:hypothetical protein
MEHIPEVVSQRADPQVQQLLEANAQQAQTIRQLRQELEAGHQGGG